MSRDQIVFHAVEVLRPRLQHKVCAIWSAPPGMVPGIGTGAIFAASGRTFVVTCGHVAGPFLRDPSGFLKAGEDELIERSQVTAVHVDEDPEVDVALLELHGWTPVDAFQSSDLAPIPDFSTYPFGGRVVLVCGMPEASTEVVDGRQVVTPLLYQAPVSTSPAPTRNHLCFPYPAAPGELWDPVQTLPVPPGVSGSLVFLIPDISDPGQLWSAESMQPVGIVVRWSQSRNYLEVVNIARLWEAASPLLGWG